MKAIYALALALLSSFVAPASQLNPEAPLRQSSRQETTVAGADARDVVAEVAPASRLAALVETHFYRQDRLKLSNKTYLGLVVIADCDYAEIVNSRFLGGLRILSSDYVKIMGCRFEASNQNGALYVAPGNPWGSPEESAEMGYSFKPGQEFLEGENRASFVGRLGQKRDALVKRDGSLLTFDLSALGKTNWNRDLSKNVWLIDGKPAEFVTIEGDDARSLGEYPSGARLTLRATNSVSASPSWFTYDAAALVRGTVIEDCTFKNDAGSGCSVYWSAGTVIRDCRGFDNKDYAIGVEFAFGAQIEGNVCMFNQVYPNFPTGYHGLEAVGHCERVVFSSNVGAIGLVPHSNYQEVTIKG